MQDVLGSCQGKGFQCEPQVWPPLGRANGKVPSATETRRNHRGFPGSAEPAFLSACCLPCVGSGSPSGQPQWVLKATPGSNTCWGRGDRASEPWVVEGQQRGAVSLLEGGLDAGTGGVRSARRRG